MPSTCDILSNQVPILELSNTNTQQKLLKLSLCTEKSLKEQWEQAIKKDPYNFFKSALMENNTVRQGAMLLLVAKKHSFFFINEITNLLQTQLAQKNPEKFSGILDFAAEQSGGSLFIYEFKKFSETDFMLKNPQYFVSMMKNVLLDDTAVYSFWKDFRKNSEGKFAQQHHAYFLNIMRAATSDYQESFWDDVLFYNNRISDWAKKNKNDFLEISKFFLVRSPNMFWRNIHRSAWMRGEEFNQAPFIKELIQFGLEKMDNDIKNQYKNFFDNRVTILNFTKKTPARFERMEKTAIAQVLENIDTNSYPFWRNFKIFAQSDFAKQNPKQFIEIQRRALSAAVKESWIFWEYSKSISESDFAKKNPDILLQLEKRAAQSFKSLYSFWGYSKNISESDFAKKNPAEFKKVMFLAIQKSPKDFWSSFYKIKNYKFIDKKIVMMAFQVMVDKNPDFLFRYKSTILEIPFLKKKLFQKIGKVLKEKLESGKKVSERDIAMMMSFTPEYIDRNLAKSVVQQIKQKELHFSFFAIVSIFRFLESNGYIRSFTELEQYALKNHGNAHADNVLVGLFMFWNRKRKHAEKISSTLKNLPPYLQDTIQIYLKTKPKREEAVLKRKYGVAAQVRKHDYRHFLDGVGQSGQEERQLWKITNRAVAVVNKLIKKAKWDFTITANEVITTFIAEGGASVLNRNHNLDKLDIDPFGTMGVDTYVSVLENGGKHESVMRTVSPPVLLQKAADEKEVITVTNELGEKYKTLRSLKASNALVLMVAMYAYKKYFATQALQKYHSKHMKDLKPSEQFFLTSLAYNGGLRRVKEFLQKSRKYSFKARKKGAGAWYFAARRAASFEFLQRTKVFNVGKYHGKN